MLSQKSDAQGSHIHCSHVHPPYTSVNIWALQAWSAPLDSHRSYNFRVPSATGHLALLTTGVSHGQDQEITKGRGKGALGASRHPLSVRGKPVGNKSQV